MDEWYKLQLQARLMVHEMMKRPRESFTRDIYRKLVHMKSLNRILRDIELCFGTAFIVTWVWIVDPIITFCRNEK